MPNVPAISFNSGLLTPQIDARSDVEKYRSGCRILENMIPRIYGPAERRPGTEYIASFNYHDSVGRLIPFIYSNTIAYIILLEPTEMRFFYDGGVVLGDDGRELIVETPYLEDELFSIDFKQVNDVMWLVHANHEPAKLSRTSATLFTLTEITFSDGPFKKRNDLDAADSVTMAPNAVTGTGKTLTASSATFDSGHVGALFKLVQPRAVMALNGSKTATVTAPGEIIGSAGLVEGDFVMVTEGKWDGTLILERSVDAGVTWDEYRTWRAHESRNIQYTGHEAEDNVQYRLWMYNLVSGTCSAELTIKSSLQEGICRITAVGNSKSATVTILKDFAETDATLRWHEGCWSDYRGWPTCVTFFEERCVYAGTAHQPQTIWLSATDDYENFDCCTKDDSAFSLTMASDTRNAIRWLSSLESLLIGTAGGEWRLRSGGYGEPITPTSYNLRPQSTHGSSGIQPMNVNDAVLFVDFVNRKVREMTFAGETDRYIAQDLTALAENVTETGITSFAYQKNPDPILWCTLTDGTLLSMTYEREQNVVAWAKHPMSKGGATESDDTKYVAGTAYPTLRVADGTFATRQDDPGLEHDIPISNVNDLQNMKSNLTGHYYLADNIDASDTVNWNGGEGFEPIGEFTSGQNTGFSGTLDGCGKTITGLYISRAVVEVGLFGVVESWNEDAWIANVTLKDCTIKGEQGVGPLVGNTVAEGYDLYIQNCHVIGTSEVVGITGVRDSVKDIGGLIGTATSGGDSGITYIYDCTTNATVDVATQHTESGPEQAGGFLGHGATAMTTAQQNSLVISNCRATGDVSCLSYNNDDGDDAGGFLGYIEEYGLFTDCSATGDVEANYAAGGFVGVTSGGQIGQGADFVRCVAHGNVMTTRTSGGGYAGGFATETAAGSLTDCYSSGNVTTLATSGYAAGLIQYASPSTIGPLRIKNCYAVGALSGPTAGGSGIGGLIQYPNPGTYDFTITECFWDTETTGEDDAFGYNPESQTGGEGHITTWMQNRDNFIDAGWDLKNVWYMPARVLWDSGAYGLGANSVAVIPTTTEDEVWVTVARLIDGAVKRYVERFKPRDFGDLEDAFFVDSGLTYDDVPEDTFTNLGHLEGETVAILGDGAVFGTQTVSGGSVTISDEVSKAHIGLPFTYKLKPMRFDLQTQKGTSKGSIKRISGLILSFFESGNVWYGKDENKLCKIAFRTTEAHDAPPALYTGDKPVPFEGGFDAEDSILIMGSDPLPCTVRAIVPTIQLTGQ